MTYSVVIRAFNEEEHIGRLLTGLLDQSVKPEEIIIVDSGSTDATLSIASRFPVKVLHIGKEEFSYGRALNIGCAEVKSEFIVNASAHVYPVYKNWAEFLLSPFSDPNVGVVYGGQQGDDGTHFSEKCIMKKWFPAEPIEKQDHTFCNNANSAIRRSLWEKFKYNENLTGLEDVAFAKQVIGNGGLVHYQQKAVVVHVHRQNYKDIFNRYYREALALKTIYPQERFGKKESFFLFFSSVISDWLSALNEKVFFKNIFNIFYFRFMQFWGTYKGFADGQVDLSGLKERFYYPGVRNKQKDFTADFEEHKIDYSEERFSIDAKNN